MSQDRSGRERSGGQLGPELETPDADQELAQHRLDVARKRRVVQRKAAKAAGAAPVRIPEGGSPLAGDVRSRMEGHLGADLSSVRVSTGGASAEAADALGARAFTDGQDVHFGAGQFAPGSKDGDRLLAHELTHVVQGQKSGIQRKKSEESDEADHEAGGLEVSEPGDTAEVEADAVADEIADNEHDPGAKGKDAGGEKPKPKAATKPVSAKLSGVGRKIYRNLATGQVTDKYHVGPGDPAKADGAFNLGGASMAENPAFEADAIEFEKKLGGVAFGRAQGIGANVIGKVKAYLASKVDVKKLDQMDAEVTKQIQACMETFKVTQDKSFAGNVKPEHVQQILLGKAQLDALKEQIAAARGDGEKLKSLPEPPNVREQMTLIYHFATNILTKDIFNAAESETKLAKLVADGKLCKEALDARVQFMVTQGEKRKQVGEAQTGKDNPTGMKGWDVVGMVPQENKAEVTPDADASKETQEAAGTPTAVDGQWSAREKRKDVETAQNKPVTPTNDPNRKAGDVAAEGAGLSGREEQMQGLSGPEDPVKWSEGARMWIINEKDQWVQSMRKLSMPLAAGPSGTTNVLMNANALLGAVEPKDMRFAAIGYLLPIHAHSLVEVCSAASAYGVPFAPGKKMYHSVPPLEEPELQATCGRQGPLSGRKLFPDEPDVAPQPAAGATPAPGAPGAPTAGAAPPAAANGAAPAAGVPAAGGATPPSAAPKPPKA